ncbi:response regulator transcription factor [Sulfurospirillum multivorans]|uniref:Two-component response regulator n=2 Tax=Sulfurospirillum multivorans TaxID=66821 RepID=A0AA86AMK2_SULMK|nr:response regulator transcription factor [Sulfurospirillum multivorans]AHJ12542.1 putative two-component response regulator [Sulfurospirillum multivorans DSM 12446]QEH06037.1 putative two-component response regulator [Sulfurospirillum multivorans]
MTQNPLRHLNILFVEDEENIRRHIVNALGYIVHEIKEASNGQEALEILKTFSPDIIMTDLEMPIMNGVELITTIRKKEIDSCIVVLTAYTSQEYLLPLINMHIEHYVIKPIRFEKMLAILQECCAKLDKCSACHDLPQGYYYDWNQKILTYQSRSITLTKKEISFLELLFHNKHRIVTYEEFQSYVWGNAVMTDDAIRSIVRNLRNKPPKDIIANLSGIGYKLE